MPIISNFPSGNVSKAELQTALADKQDKLTGTAGQMVGFDDKGNATAMQGWSNPNLLDNWYFADPINQRGQTEYTGAGYTIDRWCNGHNTMATKIEPGYISCTGTGVNLQQAVESTPIGRTVCLSVLCAGNVNLVIGYFQGGEQKFPAADHMRQEETGILTITCDIPNDATSVTVFLQTDSGTARYYAAKLELGGRQTLARKDADGNWVLIEPPPDKALELAKCQRYQLVLRGPSFINYGIAMYSNAAPMAGDTRLDDTDYIYCAVPTPVTMRTNPTVSAPNDLTYYYMYSSNTWNNVIKLIDDGPALYNASTVFIRCHDNDNGYINCGDHGYVCLQEGQTLIFDANL